MGLGNVNNTSDSDKPISTATQAALDLKAAQTGLDAVDTAVTNLPELADGVGTVVDDSLAGFVSVNRKFVKAVHSLALSNTTTETTLFATLPNFAANELSLNSLILLTLNAAYTNNTGVNQTLTLRLKLGPNTMIIWTFANIPTSASNRALYAQVNIGFQDFIGIRGLGGGIATLSAAGSGTDFGSFTRFIDTGSTYNLASSMDLDITAQHSAASANLVILPLGINLRRADAS